jgi:hypothetical protein
MPEIVKKERPEPAKKPEDAPMIAWGGSGDEADGAVFGRTKFARGEDGRLYAIEEPEVRKPKEPDK